MLSSSFFSFFFLIIVFYFLLILKFIIKKKKSQNDVVLAQLTTADNWGLTKNRIDNNWKLEDWNDKTES